MMEEHKHEDPSVCLEWLRFSDEIAVPWGFLLARIGGGFYAPEDYGDD